MIAAPSLDAFVSEFGHLFEHSPWVAERAWNRNPFAGVDALHATLMDEVAAASAAEQLALIRAHPELGVKQALTEASESEQLGAGLKNLSSAEFARFAALNAAYRQKFGFPFIICVRMQTKASIFAAFAQRLTHDPDMERAQALAEIGHITRLRLHDMKLEMAEGGAES